MSRFHSYLNSAKQILQQYHGEEPLSSFLKKYFSVSKKYGSKDRKQISHLTYSFFRLGKAVEHLSIEEKILTALFLCSKESNEMLAALKPDWNEKAGFPLEEKLSFINLPFSSVFPWKEELCECIDYKPFCESFFVQPDLFLRVRPGHEKRIKQKLQMAGIAFTILSDSCLALPNTSKIDGVMDLDNEAVVQDFSSQQVGRFISGSLAEQQNKRPAVWDCCAGSGGKSIMIYDLNPNIDLTVSDVRESILTNLKKRFSVAGIHNYHSFRIDLTREDFRPSEMKHQHAMIVADVPCTGSGTWGRTPEQLYFFDAKKILEYSSLQKRIVSNVIPYLQTGGIFIYSTCSVFKRENEEVVEFIQSRFPLRLIQKELLKGYDKKADTLFAAVFSA